MPVHVQVPIRVRLASADLADMNVVEEAVAEAVERALARSREAVVDPRGAFARPVLKSPTYLWTGRAGDVEPTAKTELEMRIARAVENACAITRLTEPIAAEDADEVFPPAIWERFDPARWDRRVRTYEIPSYGPGPKGKGRKKTARARVKSEKAVQASTNGAADALRRADSKDLWVAIRHGSSQTVPRRAARMWRCCSKGRDKGRQHPSRDELARRVRRLRLPVDAVRQVIFHERTRRREKNHQSIRAPLIPSNSR